MGAPGGGEHETSIKQSSAARDGLFGVIEVVMLLAVARGVAGARTGAGRVAVVVFLGGFCVGWALLWRMLWRQHSALHISDETIALRPGSAAKASTLSRADGDALRFVSLGGYRYRYPGLKSVGSGAVLALPYYSKKPIQAACEAHGWRFDGPSPPAATVPTTAAASTAAEAPVTPSDAPAADAPVTADAPVSADEPVTPSDAPAADAPRTANPTPDELPGLVEEGLRLVIERRQASPDFEIYASIQGQLEYLKSTLDAREVPTEEKRSSFTMGVYAAREFETSDPPFADVLFKVNYLTSRMGPGPG